MNSVGAPGILKIWQIDNFSFAIEWSDGPVQYYRLSNLQERCPCAACYDTQNDCRSNNAPSVQRDVKALVLKNIGHYALQIQFSSGCSAGLYSYTFLRKIGEKNG